MSFNENGMFGLTPQHPLLSELPPKGQEIVNHLRQEIPDGYGEERLGHTLDLIESIPGMAELFEDRQLVRLAMLDVVDPGYPEDDPKRPNSHFEDSYQMARVVYDEFDVITDRIGVEFGLSKKAMAYAFLNHDIGKAGEGHSSVMARMFNVKDERRLVTRQLGTHDTNTLSPGLQRILESKGKEGGARELSIKDMLKAICLPHEDCVKILTEQGYANLDVMMPDFYNKHENFTGILKESLSHNKNFGDEQKDIILKLATVHHNERHEDMLEQIDPKYLPDAQFMDILDKSQAFAIRIPPTDFFKMVYILHTLGEKLQNEKLRASYREMLYNLYPQLSQDQIKMYADMEMRLKDLHNSEGTGVYLPMLNGKENEIKEEMRLLAEEINNAGRFNFLYRKLIDYSKKR